MRNAAQTKHGAALSLLAAILALTTSLLGVFDESIYRASATAGNINEFLRIGSIAQDIVTIPFSVLLLVLSLFELARRNHKVTIPRLGLTAYLFYGYGLYTMQGQYTSLYLVYLAVFGLSIYSLIFGVGALATATSESAYLPKSIRIVIAIFLLSIVAVLVPVWLAQMAPAIKAHKPTDTYCVFLLDLTIVFPALAIAAIMLLRNNPFGCKLAGIVLFKAFTVCLSVAFGEWYVAKERVIPLNVSGLILFSALTTISSVLFIVYLHQLQIQGTTSHGSSTCVCK